MLAGITVGYALSPIDLIPDFIPILGFLDDLIILPFLVYLTLKTILSGTIEKYRAQSTQPQMRKNWKYAIPIVVFYILLVVIIVKIFF